MKKLYINPLPVRIWHWINATCFVLMILTGVQSRFIGQIDLGLSFRTAVTVHNYVGFALMANFLLWLGFYLFTDKITVYHTEPNREKFFEDTFKQMRYYGYGIFRGEPNPHHVTPYHKFNPMQSMMYQIVMMILLPMQFATGLMMWDVKRFETAVDLLGGVRVVDTVHVLLFIFFTAFLFMHAYMGTLGAKASTHYREMVTGYEEIPEPGDSKTGRA